MLLLPLRSVAVTGLLAALASSVSAAAQDGTSAAFRRILAAQYEAIARGDTAALRTLFSDSLVWVLGATGTAIPKSTLVAALARPEDPPVRFEVDSVRVRQLGAVALVDYRRTDRRRVGETPLNSHWRVLAVYGVRSDRWVLERHMQTWVVAASAPIALDSATQAPFVGRYAVGPGNVDEVYWRNTQLHVRNGTEAVGPALIPVSGSAFRPNGTGALLVFERDTAGRVTGYVQGFPDGRLARARRLP